MDVSDGVFSEAMQLFEPDPDAIFTLEEVEGLAHVSRHTILVYFKQGMIPLAADPDTGYLFNSHAVRALRRIDYLHNQCGINLAGTRMIMELLDRVERLEMEVRARR